MYEDKRDPKEDIYLIRRMLDQSMDGLNATAPWLEGIGFIWLAYGIFSSVQKLFMPRVSLSSAEKFSRAGTVVGFLFCVILAIGVLVCRSRLSRLGKNSLARKLVDMWGVCIFLYLSMTILLNPVITRISVALGFSIEAVSALHRACGLCRSILFLLVPVAPLLMTAGFLDDFRMRLAGIALAVLAAFVLCFHALMLFGDGTVVRAEWQIIWLVAACLLDLAPGAILLLFGRQMKGR